MKDTSTPPPSKPSQKSSSATIDQIKKGRTDIFQLDPADMVPAPLGETTRLNTRNDFGDLESLCDSLIEHGCKTILRGHMNSGGKFEITDGERRWRAACLAKERGHNITLPCRPEPRNYTDEERIVDLFTCNGGLPLGILEEAHAMKLLLGRGWDEKQIATKTHRSLTHVANCLILLASGDHILSLVASGRMSATLAIEFIAAEPDPAQQIAHLIVAEQNAAASESDRITARHLPIKVGKARQAEQRGQTDAERIQQTQINEGIAADLTEQERLANLPDDPNHVPSNPFEGKDCTETTPQVNDFGGYISGVQEKKLPIPFAMVSGLLRFVERPDGQIASGIVFKFPGSFETKRGMFEQVTDKSPVFPSIDHAKLNAFTRMHEEITLAMPLCVNEARECYTSQHFKDIIAWFEEEIEDLAATLGSEVHLPQPAQEPAPQPQPTNQVSDASEVESGPIENPAKALNDLVNSLAASDCSTERRQSLITIQKCFSAMIGRPANPTIAECVTGTLAFAAKFIAVKNAEKAVERVRTLSIVLEFIAGTTSRETLAKYLLEVID